MALTPGPRPEGHDSSAGQHHHTRKVRGTHKQAHGPTPFEKALFPEHTLPLPRLPLGSAWPLFLPEMSTNPPPATSHSAGLRALARLAIHSPAQGHHCAAFCSPEAAPRARPAWTPPAFGTRTEDPACRGAQAVSGRETDLRGGHVSTTGKWCQAVIRSRED